MPGIEPIAPGQSNKSTPTRARFRGKCRMLRIQKPEKGGVIFKPSGQMDEETMAELETLLKSEPNGRHIALGLKDLTLVSEDAVIFLERCESNRIAHDNCPPYIHEWINRQRRGS